MAELRATASNGTTTRPTVGASQVMPVVWRTFKLRNTIAAEAVAMAVTVMLFYFILTKLSVILRPYKKVLCFGAFINFVLAVVNLLFRNSVFSVDGVYFVVLEGVLGCHLPPRWNYVGIFMSYFVPYLTVFTGTVQFVFQALLVCRNFELSYKELAFLTILSGIMTALLTGKLCQHFYPSTAMFTQYDRYFDDSWRNDQGQLPVYGASAVEVVKKALPYYPAVFGPCYALMLFCSYGIVRKLYQKHMTAAHRGIQRQLACVLLVEALVPFVTVTTPVVLHWLTIEHSIFSTRAGQIATLAIAWAPVVNPIATLLLIRAFRRNLFAPYYRFKENKEFHRARLSSFNALSRQQTLDSTSKG